ncbi:FecR family protein [Pseudomonas sp. nanlin1]|uniref:FecR family protein n=1 Tax=Pseudomonas sp. nanlin1 TaxID=3040605 RepID=UPI00388F7B8A
MKPQLANDPVWNKALDWLECLHKHPDDARLQAQCDAWKAQDPAHARAWKRAQRVWQPTTGAAPLAAATLDTFADAYPARPPRRRRWWALTAIAILAVAVVPQLPVWQADYHSETGRMLHVALSDGSQVTLGSDTLLNERFSPGQRDVELLRGEAFFDVTPDTNRPFVVKAGSGSVRVTGTAFDVQFNGQRLDVAVQHGSVKVSDQRMASPALNQTLVAGERLQLDYQHASTLRNRTRAQQIASWRQGQLIADDQPIAELLQNIRRYYPGLIVLNDEVFGERKVTGVYNLNEPEAALRALVQAHGGRVKALGPWVLLVLGS